MCLTSAARRGRSVCSLASYGETKYGTCAFSSIGQKPGWDKRYEHLEEACHDCLSFSSEDLCSHQLADHNYFAVCSGLLAPRAFHSSMGGLLHSVPPDVEKRLSLSALLAACDRPSDHGRTRFEAASELREALALALEERPASAWPSVR